jgi:F0F1-type ATP synthase membrane subunit b/b'
MILVWAIVFVGFWKLIDKYLFSPYLRLVEAREEGTSGALSKARDTEAKAEILLKEYESRIIEERIHAMKIKLSKLSDAKKKASEIVERAQNEAEEYVKNARSKVTASIASIKQESFQDVDKMSDMIVQRIREGRA